MPKLIINTLSVGLVYEMYTRYLFKQIDKLGIEGLIFCVTSDRDFSKSLKSSRVNVSFNLLDGHSVANSGASHDVYRSTVFKYYLKSLAIKYAASEFPNHSILHIDCDSIPNENFNLEFVNENNSPGIYCGEFVSCSGHYGILKDETGKIHINRKIPAIFEKYLNNTSTEEIYDLKFPIENKLLFNDIPAEKIISFCDSWYDIGNYLHGLGLPTYGDCFEIKAAAIINDINIFKINNLQFNDWHKNNFLEELKKNNNGSLNTIEDSAIEEFLENFPTKQAPQELKNQFSYAAMEGRSYSNELKYDAAYGAGDKFSYKYDITGSIVFDNQTFGDPCLGIPKNGYVRVHKNDKIENIIKKINIEKVSCFGAPFDINFSSCGKINPNNFIWSNEDQEINVYIDNAIGAGIHSIKNKDKSFGWICESRMISPHITNDVILNYEIYKKSYKKIFTYDDELIKIDPVFFEYCFPGSNYPWTPKDEFGIHKKTKLVSFLSSKKNMCTGHAYRLEWANRLNGLVDFYGGIMNSRVIGGSHCYHHNKKTEALNDYMFSIVLENCKIDTYFTEKITDCFANGTIPIYFGTDKINSIFNSNGIITLTDEFDISILNEDLYYSKMEAILENLEIVKNMPLADEMLYKKIITGN